MNPMNELERLESCFKQWLAEYKEDEWGFLSTIEIGQLLDFHFENFINILSKQTKQGDYPFSDKK